MSKDISEFSVVQFIGAWDKELHLSPGEIGYVLEDYGDGNVEIEFSLPDGTTWLQYTLPKSKLQIVEDGSMKDLKSFSRDYAYPLIQKFEAGEQADIHHPETGEVISVDFETGTKSVVLQTASLGRIFSVLRPYTKPIIK